MANKINTSIFKVGKARCKNLKDSKRSKWAATLTTEESGRECELLWMKVKSEIVLLQGFECLNVLRRYQEKGYEMNMGNVNMFSLYQIRGKNIKITL